MECKELSVSFYAQHCLVLIETLWNVKNLRAPRKLTEEQSINRNIVECKAAKKRRRKNPEDCINRNIMECQRLRTIFYIGIPPLNVNPTLNLHSTFAKSIVFQFFHPDNIRR